MALTSLLTRELCSSSSSSDARPDDASDASSAGAPRAGGRMDAALVVEGSMLFPELDSFPRGLRVLVVEDDPVCGTLYQQHLENAGYEVTLTTGAKEACTLLKRAACAYHGVLTDVKLRRSGAADGFDVLDVAVRNKLPVVLVSGDASGSLHLRAAVHGAVAYLQKPVRKDDLKDLWRLFLAARMYGVRGFTLGSTVATVSTLSGKHVHDFGHRGAYGWHPRGLSGVSGPPATPLFPVSLVELSLG